MIDYKLAKQLKDAGFPQKTASVYAYDEAFDGDPNAGYDLFHLDVEEHREHIAWHEQPEYVAAPTLSELIDACKELREKKSTRVMGLGINLWIGDCNDYSAMAEWPKGKDSKAGYDKVESEGDTPEEAVAKLWLGLNAKK